MKKILGVSFAAMLAVSPMLAKAEAGDQVAKINASAPTASSNIASTSYVQGAYKAAADKIDAVIEDATVTGEHKYIDAGKSVSHNLVELDTQLGAVSSTVENYSTDLDSKQDKSASTVAAGTYNHISQGNGVASNLVALDTAVKAAKDVADAAQKASDSTATAGTYVTAGTGVGANLNALDSQLATVSSTVGTLSTGSATKEGVVATINKSGVTVYQDWNAGGTPSNPVTVNVQAGGASHNEYYATIASATGVAQPESIVTGGPVEP